MNSLTTQSQSNIPEISRDDFDRNINTGNVFKDYLLMSLKNNPTAVQIAEEAHRQKMAISLASQRLTATSVLPNVFNRIEDLYKEIASLKKRISEQKDRVDNCKTEEAKDLAVLALTNLNRQLNDTEATYLKYLDTIGVSDTIKNSKGGNGTNIKIEGPFANSRIQMPPRQEKPDKGNTVDVEEEKAEVHINLSNDLDEIL